MPKIESLESIALGLTFLVPLLTLFLPLFKDFISSTISRVIKERSAIAKLRLDLDNLVPKERYIQDINILNSRTLKNISFEKVNILLRKNISLTHLIDISEVTKKKLCTYVPASKEIRIVSENDYKTIKKKDKRLWSYLIIFLLLIVAFIIDTIFFKDIVTMGLLFVLALFFELVWLLRKSPYDSYRALIKSKDILATQGITVAEDITT